MVSNRNDNRPLHGKVVLITGGSRGIGRASALALARAGAMIAVNHSLGPRGVEPAQEVVKEAQAYGVRAVAMPADVSDHSAVVEMVDKILETFGHLDILVSNAGITNRKRLVETTEAEWDQIISVNLKGTYNVIHAVLPHMIQQRSGKVVTVSSELALVGSVGADAYVASKTGIIGLTKCVAREVAPLGINVNCVAPGPTDTDMLSTNPNIDKSYIQTIPLRRLGLPEDIAPSVLFLVSDEASYYCGQVLSPNGGTVI